MSNRSRGIAITYAFTILNLVIGVLISSYIVKTLGKTEYGLYSMMGAFVSYLTLFEFGIGTIMSRNISLCKGKNASDDEINTHISTLWILTLCLIAVIILVAGIFCILIPHIYVKSLSPDQISYCEILFILSVLKLIFTFPVQTMGGIFIAYENYTLTAKLNLIKLIVRTILVVCLLFFYGYAWVLLSIDFILTFIEFLYDLYMCLFKFKIKFRFKYFDSKILKSIVPLALAMLLQTVMNMANNNVDNFVIGIMLSPEKVAVYAVAMYVFSCFSSFTAKPITMYMPQVAKDMQMGKTGLELTKTLVGACRLTALIGGALLFGFVAMGKPFIRLLYGEEYLLAWGIAVLVMIPHYINMSNSVILNVLDVLNKRHIRSIMLMGTTIANIILTVIWIKIWGIVGAAMATAICTMIGNVALMNIYYKKAIGIHVMFLYYETFKGILLPFLIAAIVGYYSSAVFSANILNLISGFVAFLSVAFILYWAFGATASEKEFIAKRIKILKK